MKMKKKDISLCIFRLLILRNPKDQNEFPDNSIKIKIFADDYLTVDVIHDILNYSSRGKVTWPPIRLSLRAVLGVFK